MASGARNDVVPHGGSRLTYFEFRSSEFLVLSTETSGRAGTALSRSEQDVLAQIVAGRTYAQIAASRRRSRHTVAHQVSAILRKLGVASKRELLLAVGSPTPLPRKGNSQWR